MKDLYKILEERKILILKGSLQLDGPKNKLNARSQFHEKNKVKIETLVPYERFN